MQPHGPTGIRDEAFISASAQFISEGGMPIEWQKEMLKRYLYYYALFQEMNGERGPASTEQLYIL